MSTCLFREGDAITPSDRQGFDRRWSAPNLERVYTPLTAEDALNAAENFIRTYNHDEVQIVSGRHCYENFVYSDKTKCIVDVTGLRDFGLDKDKGYYIGTGNANWDMYQILNNVFGKTLPAGSCYSVGLGGHVTGGGYGLLSRLYGLTVDWLTGVSIVVIRNKRAELIYCDKDKNADLFWALRGGGGGNFGIITHYYFKELPRSPDYMYISTITLPWANITRDVLFQYFQTYAENECYQGQQTWNNFNIFHINHKKTGSLSLSSFTYYDKYLHGDINNFEQYLLTATNARKQRYASIGAISNTPAPHIGHPAWLADNGLFLTGEDALPYRKYTYLEGTQNVNGSGPNRYGKYKSAYLKQAIPRDQSDKYFYYMTEQPDGADLSSTLFQLDSYGGKINKVQSKDTAIAQRSSIVKIQYETYWYEDSQNASANTAVAEANVKWLQDMYKDVYANWDGIPLPRGFSDPLVDGCYFNYCDIDIGVNNSDYSMDGAQYPIDRAMTAYFGNNYVGAFSHPSIFRIKQAWNPDNWFASSQSIPAVNANAAA
ncbi:MAG: FAD-binding protein [Chelatococcus sp.]|uniref:FAD-binding protein n=1 Tax=Chelatococcus sp. TaxID=1953771 RepID=UPI0025C73C22|nr:FAD-binding protein [Chelatococcus sp.]MBX3538657.1 FAD-binding protein [Chelatococcus sp.]